MKNGNKMVTKLAVSAQCNYNVIIEGNQREILKNWHLIVMAMRLKRYQRMAETGFKIQFS